LKGTNVVAENWVLQRRPRSLFSYAAVVTTILFIIGVIANVMMAYHGAIPIPKTIPFKIFGVLVGVVGASAALWLWVGMCWYWVQLDQSSRWSKIFWFIILLLGNWAGATAYYFLIYRRASILRPLGRS
jgi:hypothetical protein